VGKNRTQTANSPYKIENTQAKIKTEHKNGQKIGKELKPKPDASVGETSLYNLNSVFSLVAKHTKYLLIKIS
jgi:3-methyladenine DNA glycosylase Tag